MKKILIALVSALLIAPVVSNAQGDASEETMKYAKKMEKKMEKDGWKIFGSSYMLHDVLAKHYAKLESLGSGARELSATASGSNRQKNLLIQQASTNAFNAYAGECRKVVGMEVNDMEISKEERNDFLATYQSKVEAEIQGELQLSFIIIRETTGDEVEAQVFYVVDETAAERARVRALEIATQGMNLTSEISDKLNQAVRKNVK